MENETAPVAETQQQAPETEQQQAPPAELDDATFLESYNKRFGKDLKSIDELRPPAPEKTEEEIRAIQNSEDLMLTERFVKQGGTVGGFAALKQIAAADVKEFSLQDTKAELRTAGFAEDEIDEEIKRRYFLLSAEEKENLGEFDDEMLKKNEYFSKKLENKSSYKIDQAKNLLAKLKSDYEAEKYEKEVDARISSTVEDYAAKFNRTVTLDLGESNGQKLNPVEYVIDEADITEIKETLANKAKRETQLYNQDGSENVTNLFDAFVWKKIAASVAKKSLLQGATEQVNFFNGTFPSNAQAVSPGYVANTRTGQVGKAIEGTEKVSVRTSSITK